ncbi:MAG: HAMP domain-containing sensor histidine kinase [Myxococcales bacterium]
MKYRLQWQIFTALALTGALCVGLAVLIGSLIWEDRGAVPRFVQGLGSIIVSDLPKDDRMLYEQTLKQRAEQLDASISVWDERGTPIASSGRQLKRRDLNGKRGVYDYSQHTLWITLDQGGTLALAINHPPDRPGFFRMALSVLFAAILFGSYIAARWITRRLKVLEEGVTKFGEGDLEARVTLPGGDEISRLADAFNNSSTRIAGLVTQQRRLLQSASHELRSPLARLGMALELLSEPEQEPGQRERLRADAARDIEELDQLIGDLLLSGRLADSGLPKDFVPVSMAPLLREEAVRVGAALELDDTSEVYSVAGNPRMLRSLIRNLLENARRHGQTPIRTALRRERPGELVLTVDDSGAGVAEAEREKIFEPFYRPKGHRETQDGGVGLGLFLVKSLVEHHGGQVRYVALPQGSRFEVRLPA